MVAAQYVWGLLCLDSSSCLSLSRAGMTGTPTAHVPADSFDPGSWRDVWSLGARGIFVSVTRLTQMISSIA